MDTNRKQLISGLVKDAREPRLCGPSDDPDELTAVTSGYYYLVVQVKRLVAPYLPEHVAARLNSIEVEINDIYSTYTAKAELDALIPDVEDALEQMGDKSMVRASAHQSGFAGDDYGFARQAIEEARKSAPEDSRIHPKVGVVVVKDGRILATAHRGEIPQCHAEFIALEKKLTDVALLGATVYTTLEPCTSRNHPKIPAIRLTERKVSRVVIGMLDPDDRISGRGQRALRKAGIATELFPHDLMGEVEELNRDFMRDRESYQSHLPEAAPRVRVALKRGHVSNILIEYANDEDEPIIIQEARLFGGKDGKIELTEPLRPDNPDMEGASSLIHDIRKDLSPIRRTRRPAL